MHNSESMMIDNTLPKVNTVDDVTEQTDFNLSTANLSLKALESIFTQDNSLSLLNMNHISTVSIIINDTKNLSIETE